MSTTSINLGTADRLTVLYSYPNFTGDTKSLADTIVHWFGQTLVRDGCAGASASVRIDGTGNYFLDLTGPDNLAASFAGYAKRLPQFLANGWAAWTDVVPMLQKTGKWDPCPDKSTSTAPYLPWRFFLPHGMPMLNQKALLFFHYPPIRLLETNQDYLDDPVPVRCEELLAANGVASLPDNLASGDIMLFNTVMDATPIGAEDDQGSKNPQQCAADGCPPAAYDKDYGLIPIQYFADYQKAQVSLLLNPSPKSGYTAPIVIYGAHPLATFNKLYGTNLKVYQTTVVTGILPGLKTPVLASSHPYVFYGQAQGFDKIGSGNLVNVPAATGQMIKDLAVSRWLKAMSDDPSQPVADVWAAAQKFWNDPAQAAAVSSLVQHQGSLWYNNPPTLDFIFKVPLQPAATAKPAPAAKTTLAVKSAAAGSGLKVIGDSGAPVDWWFAYKVSEESQPQGSVTGTEYLYYDADAAKVSAPLKLSPNKMDQQQGALFKTLSQIYSATPANNPSLAWFFYNDENPDDKSGYKNPVNGLAFKPGEVISSRGHTKGVLALDLDSDTAIWLIHSVPKFAWPEQFTFPKTGVKEAQTLLCVTLPDVATALKIATQMFNCQQPNVYAASPVPPALAQNPAASALVSLMNNKIAAKPAFVSSAIPFTSPGNQDFQVIAKNKSWGQDQNPKWDFYNDLVGKILDENLDVETWEHYATPPAADHDSGHEVFGMNSVNLSNLSPGYNISWSDAFDHAKLAISAPTETVHWVCVGDINFTKSMENRGGGTLAFICDSLWQPLNKILSAAPEPGIQSANVAPKKSAVKPAALAPNMARKSAPQSVASKPVASAKPPAKKTIKTKAPLRKAAPKKATPKKQPVKKAAPKKKAPAKAASKKQAPSAKKTAKSKVTPKKKTAVKKTPAKKTAPKKAAPKKTSKKAAPKKPAAKAVKKKAAKKAGKKR